MIKTDTTPSGKPKRRWLNIGPGIILALAVSALIGSQWIKTQIKAQRQHGAPPIIERRVISSSYEDKSGPTPEVKFIIDRRAKIGLTNTQMAQLRVLQSRWEKYYTPKIAQANLAAEKTRKYLDDAKGRSRMPVAVIQSEAGEVIALSGEISAARRNFWNQAVVILTPEQRKLIQKERETD